MSKQKLAELVLQKMQEKKQKQERNRPHRQVLQLLVKFQVEDYQKLQKQIEQLGKQISHQQDILNKLETQCQQFENTGKKVYPRIIVKPDFIASQNIQALVKQFYRKASNTFLREDLLRKKQYQLDSQRVQQIMKAYLDLKNKQMRILKQEQIQHQTINEKRVRNLKQDLRLRSIKQEQQNIKMTIQQQKDKHQDLLAEYELKKVNLHKRIDWSQKLTVLIANQKKTIEQAYNPITYREYLKKIFNLRTINQSIQKCMLTAKKQVQQIQTKTQKKSQFLQKHDNLFIQGKCTDSPSKKKRYSLGAMQKQKKIYPKHNSLLFNLKKSVTVQESIITPQKTLAKNKSFANSLGKTTASSMSNLLKSTSRRSTSAFSQLKKSKNFKRLGETLG